MTASDHPYSAPIQLDQVQGRVRSKIEEIRDRSSRYSKSAKRYRNWSLGFRVAALIAVLFFALATYICSVNTHSPRGPTTVAKIFMVIGRQGMLPDVQSSEKQT